MTERLYRAQLLLDPKQHYVLRQIADSEGRSVSDLVREMIDDGIALRARAKAERHRAVEQLAAVRRSIDRRQGVLTDDAVAEVRAERGRQLDRALAGNET